MSRSWTILLGALAVTLASADPELVSGQVVLSIPHCDLFVVKTAEGFTAVRKREHWAVFEGDEVRGSLHRTGESQVEVVGEVTIAAVVEGWALGLRAAKRLFYRSCIPHRERFLNDPP